jgi:hypothetical protein
VAHQPTPLLNQTVPSARATPSSTEAVVIQLGHRVAVLQVYCD